MRFKKFAINYTIFNEFGQILDTNVHAKPVVITIGRGEFLPYVEECLVDCKVGDALDVVIPPEKGFGEHKSILVKETARENLPPQLQQVGTMVELVDEQGIERCAKVISVTDKTVTLDFNHPFAGIKLICSIKVNQAYA